MFNTNLGAKLVARSKELFGKLESIATQSGLIVRRSKKFSAGGLLTALLKAVISGKGSFTEMAMVLADTEAGSLTPQALWKRIDAKATDFMREVLAQAMMQRWLKEHIIACDRFSRVIIEDSSQAKLPKANAETFPAHGNDKGETAGCKFDLAFDLLKGQVISNSLHLATEQDREIGKDVVGLVEANDLYLRDMGYFSVPEFRYIEAHHAFWLSRLPANVTVHDLVGRKLETILRTARTKRVDLSVEVGEARHQARLIAVKADPKIAQQRRRERKEKTRQNGKTASKDTLLRTGWHLIITNVPMDTMKAQDLFKLYSVRWQIEITFRAWKQSASLVEALKRRSNQDHLEALMYAGMLLLVLTLHVSSLLQQSYRKRILSIEKIAGHLAAFFMKVTSLQVQFGAYCPDPRHIQMNRRARKSLHEIAVTTLG